MSITITGLELDPNGHPRFDDHLSILDCWTDDTDQVRRCGLEVQEGRVRLPVPEVPESVRVLILSVHYTDAGLRAEGFGPSTSQAAWAVAI